MESLGTGRNGAQRGRKGQKGAERGAKGQEEAGRAERGRKRQKEAFPLPAPVPSDSIAGPLKTVKRA